MKHKKQVLLSVLLTLVFLTLSVSPTLAADVQAAYAKIPDDLLTAFDGVGSNGTIDVVVWLEDNSTEEFQSIVNNIPEPSFETNSDPETYGLRSVSETASALSDEERMAQIDAMQSYIMQKRQIAQAVYLEDNTAVAEELAESGGDIVYISKYSPLVICNVTRSQAVNMAMSDSVLSITRDETIADNCMDISSEAISAVSLHDNALTGQGVKIGMIESAAPDVDAYACFDGIENKIIIRPYTHQVSSDAVSHASYVAAIMVGNESGIARGFDKLYCTTSGVSPGENYAISYFVENIEWLLDQGVNVINSSWGIQAEDRDSHTMHYGSYAAWQDHIAYNHSVHLVISSGNWGADKILYNAQSYNVITVGATNDKNTLSKSDDTIWHTSATNASAYNSTEDSYPYKPDLCAPGCAIDIPNVEQFPYDNRNIEDVSGTSMAAPHVTGVIALLCGHAPTLLTKQALMKSLLLSSVSTKASHRYDTRFDTNGNVSSGYRQYGSGIVNAYNAKILVDSGNYVNGSITASEGHDTISIGNLYKGQTVTVTLSFLRRMRFTTSDHSFDASYVENTLADLDLYIAPVATYVGGACTRDSTYIKSITSNNNVEKIIYTAPSTGEYVICVDKYAGQGSYEILYGVSWLVDNATLQ